MRPEEVVNNRILFSPLNWGMGHVSRSISLIHQLINQQNEIIIACDEAQKRVYLEYFPNLTYVFHEGYPFTFNGKGNFISDMLSKSLALNRRQKVEESSMQLMIDKYNIDIVLSDHRYGFRSDIIHSIFITHQLNLPVKWYQKPIQLKHSQLLKKFNDIWVLDYQDSSLAGMLSKNNNFDNVTYIGPYSRLSLYERSLTKNNVVLIASGPDVYAQQFVDESLKREIDSDFYIVASEKISLPENINKSSSSWREQDQLIINAKKIISRSGYSTIMDLDYLQIESELIPTKGQYEQEYLKTLRG